MRWLFMLGGTLLGKRFLARRANRIVDHEYVESKHDKPLKTVNDPTKGSNEEYS